MEQSIRPMRPLGITRRGFLVSGATTGIAGGAVAAKFVLDETSGSVRTLILHQAQVVSHTQPITGDQAKGMTLPLEAHDGRA